MPKIDTTGYQVRRDKVSKTGNVTLRYRGRLYHIGLGHAFTGQRILMLVAGRSVTVILMDGSPLRRLTLDPSRNYQRMP
jgi:hypothetical protein